jgi:hypothetical protein
MSSSQTISTQGMEFNLTRGISINQKDDVGFGKMMVGFGQLFIFSDSADHFISDAWGCGGGLFILFCPL